MHTCFCLSLFGTTLLLFLAFLQLAVAAAVAWAGAGIRVEVGVEGKLLLDISRVKQKPFLAGLYRNGRARSHAGIYVCVCIYT